MSRKDFVGTVALPDGYELVLVFLAATDLICIGEIVLGEKVKKSEMSIFSLLI